MDKYSKKIIEFINIINIDLPFLNINNPFILNINNIIKTIKTIKIPRYDIKFIKKVNNDNTPLLYNLYSKCFPNEIKNLSDFIKYYTLEQLNSNDIKQYLFDDDMKNLYRKIYEENNDRIEIKKIFYDNTFVSIDILYELESNDLQHIYIDNDDYSLSIYYYNIDNINEYINNIIFIIYIIKNINEKYKISNVKKYNVIMFLGNQKKYLFGNMITQMNMNSGSSMIEIFVTLWRKEEYEKVLIHELCHYIGIDHNIFTNNDIKEINNNFNIKGINHISESYNETIASIINMCWKYYKLNNLYNFKIDLQQIYIIEIKFLLFQTAKYIDFFNGKCGIDLFRINILQNTSGLSYIVLKMILLHNINDFMNLINEFNIICDDINKIDTYKLFLEEKIKNKSYVQSIDYIFNIIKKINKDKFIYKTFRMSVI
jgi:hypothetical protein